MELFKMAPGRTYSSIYKNSYNKYETCRRIKNPFHHFDYMIYKPLYMSYKDKYDLITNGPKRDIPMLKTVKCRLCAHGTAHATKWIYYNMYMYNINLIQQLKKEVLENPTKTIFKLSCGCGHVFNVFDNVQIMHMTYTDNEDYDNHDDLTKYDLSTPRKIYKMIPYNNIHISYVIYLFSNYINTLEPGKESDITDIDHLNDAIKQTKNTFIYYFGPYRGVPIDEVEKINKSFNDYILLINTKDKLIIATKQMIRKTRKTPRKIKLLRDEYYEKLLNDLNMHNEANK